MLTGYTSVRCSYIFDSKALLYENRKRGSFYNNNLYILGDDSLILEYNFSKGEVTATYRFSTDFNTNKEIEAVQVYNGKLYVLYRDKSSTKNKCLFEKTISSMTKTTETEITDHTAYSHTKEQISQKYKDAMTKFDYSQSMYQTEPVLTAPFKEGTLKTQVKQDALNKLNFYRWLYGINTVTLNESRMYKNARAALAMKVTDQLSHYPSRVEGMTDEFYQDVKEGAGAGSNYSGNVSYGYSNMSDAIVGYINDNYNISAGVGHRTSMFDTTANQVSFGICGSYNAMSVYTTSSDLGNKDKFYSYPTPGYFPIDEYELIASDEATIGDTKWSLTIPGNEYEIDNSKLKLRITLDGKTYEISNLEYDSYEKTISYYIPGELKVALTEGSEKIVVGKKVTIELYSGIYDENFNRKKIKYTTEFFAANPIEATSVNVYFNNVSTSVGEEKICTLDQGEENTVKVFFVPYNTTDTRYKITIDDTSIARYDENTKKVTGVGPGQTYLYVKTLSGKVLRKVRMIVDAKDYSVQYTTHVQEEGWQDWVSDGETAGTTGKSLRLEGIKIKVNGSQLSGGVTYSTHIQEEGWQSWKNNGDMSGTTGKSLRLEAIQIKLTGDAANKYDIYYRVHAQEFGWLGWAKNGASAGTQGYSYRLEGIQIKLVKKGGSAPGSTANAFHQAPPTVMYTTHVQDLGWQTEVKNGATAGTVGKSLRLEGIKIRLTNQLVGGNIVYQTHVQELGWQPEVKNGAIAGTTGRKLRLEAIRIRLTDELAKKYDIYYRVHAQEFGWLGWAKNGESAGTSGYSYRLEGIEIKILEKGSTPPTSTSVAYKSK